MSRTIPIISCHDCGLLQQISHMPEDGAAKCCRCDATLRKRQRIQPAKSIEHTLALVITALVLLVISNVFPIVQVQAEGHEMAATLFGCVKYLFTNDMKLLGGLVFVTSIGAPVIQLTGLLYILLPVNFNRIPTYAPQVYRLVRIITSWSMLEVLMLGILVSVVKLSALATVVPSIALWTFGLLMIFIAAILNDLDTEMLWEQVSPKTRVVEIQNIKQGTQLANCHNCHLLCTVSAGYESCCPRCGAAIHFRKPNSLTRCTALVIAATIKLIILYMLLITVHFKSHWRPKERTRLYRLTEVIGRWSMVDIFVDTLMAALIQIQGLMVIEVGVGAVAFGAVVVLTMLAAMAFYPRLIWDNMEKVNE